MSDAVPPRGGSADPGPPERVPAELAEHPDRLRWNAKYGDAPGLSPVHPLAERALSSGLPDGEVLDLASGPSGSALLAAAAGRPVTAVDVSEIALGRLGAEAGRRGLASLITLVQADLAAWRPHPAGYALVLCTGFWDRAVFGRATGAVLPGGLLAWEAFTEEARRHRPGLPAEWCLGPAEPASLLPDVFTVLEQADDPATGKRGLLARRHATPRRAGP
ncbi:class I SAM-dependent methyltransferase [Actinomadura sp. 6K520]|uniref:methyltransferase domain-containing protein n=1 Tax=Actinomadura sp. 6K520 TaxID=2530364 RepID=UPI00104B5E23|nr:class I SAM-dependent methyltransferase [Actinomadura sp. 6K520]TDE32029.1 class I SAM-dependent methyltransferase [Actinomadura sp. 6K520]